MPTPKDAAGALRRAVDAQAAQRIAAQSSRKQPKEPREEGVERPDTDADQ